MEKPRVIIADSSTFARRVVRQFLSHEEIELHEVEDRERVLDRARSIKPALIILDERIVGQENNLLGAIRADNSLLSIPVILLRDKGSESSGLKTESSDIGSEKASEIIEKPLDGNKLRKTVRQILRLAIEPEEPETSPSEVYSGASFKDFADFSDSDFTRFRDFLMRKVGLFFDTKRKQDLARALNRRMKSMGLRYYPEYYDYLNQSLHEEKELKNLILHLTIGETTFFRSPDQFLALKGYIIPKIIEARSAHVTPRLRIWSAGISTGEEPYSIAIALKESIPDLDRWDVVIHATDINNKFLKFAERGTYPARKVRFVKEDILKNYFKFDGDGYTVDPSLKKYINFGYHNLSSDNYAHLSGADVIFCRNVLIYFKRDRIRDVIDRFRDILNVNGYLMLGYSETLFQISDDFSSIHYGDAFFYRRLSDSEKAETHRRNGVHENLVRQFINKKLAIETEKSIETPKPPIRLVSPPPPVIEASKLSRIHDEITEKERPSEEFKAGFTYQATSAEMNLWEEGMELYFQEKFDLAEKTFKSISATYPGSARARLGEAFILANSGADIQALEKIERAIEIDDLLPESYYLRALLHEKEGRIDHAIKDYQNVILLDTNFAMAHFNLAILYMKRGLMRDSRRELANTLNILKRYEQNRHVKFSGGLHREALMQLCQDLEA